MAIDQHALSELYDVNQKIREAYAWYDFTADFPFLGDYCSVDLSSFYLDVIKDRFYVEKANGYKRRSAQTACWYILDTLTHLMAPILSFTAEQISDFYQKDKKESIHLQHFASLDKIGTWYTTYIQGTLVTSDLSAMRRIDTRALDNVNLNMLRMQREELWQALKHIRSAVLKSLEGLREQGIIKHSLESRVTLCFTHELAHKEVLEKFFEEFENDKQQPLAAFFKEFFIVSQLIIADDCSGLENSEYPGLKLKVERAIGDKCPRCWHYDVTDHPHKLCNRCQAILK